MPNIQAFVPGPMKQRRVILPDSATETKVILYKIRLRPGEPWLGSGASGDYDPNDPRTPGPIRVPYNLDIDEAYVDGMSIRKHIHLRLTGLLELRYGTFVYQEGDQMQSTTVIQEVSGTDWDKHAPRIWSQFIKSESDGR